MSVSPKTLLVCAPDGASGKIPTSLEPSTVGSTPLIFCPGAFGKNNKNVLQLLEERGYFFKEKMELDSFPSVRAFGLRGMGFAVLPQRLAESSVHSRNLTKISMKGISSSGIGPHSIYATVRNSRVSDPRIVLFLKELRKWFSRCAAENFFRLDMSFVMIPKSLVP